MRVAVLVVHDGTPARCVLDVTLFDAASLALRRSRRQLEDVERGTGVSARASGNLGHKLVGQRRAELRGAAADQEREIIVRQRFELVDLAAREQRGVDLKVRVLGRGPDESDQAALDRGQQRILLRLVEAVDLVEEEDRAPSLASEPVPGRGNDCADVGYRGGDGRLLLESRTCNRSDDARERRLPAPGRPVKDRGGNPVLLDRAGESRALPDHVPLTDEIVEAGGAEKKGARGG